MDKKKENDFATLTIRVPIDYKQFLDFMAIRTKVSKTDLIKALIKEDMSKNQEAFDAFKTSIYIDADTDALDQQSDQEQESYEYSGTSDFSVDIDDDDLPF